MNQDSIQYINALLRQAEQQLDQLTLASAAQPQPVSFELRAEYAAYLSELNQAAAQWQAQTQQLLQILSDHPGLISRPDPVVVPPDTALLDRTYQRLTLAASWERHSPTAFMHAGALYALPRPSFREVYRQVLGDLVVRLRGELGPRCLAYQGAHRIAVTRDEDVYHHAVFRTDGYLFNIQLAADTIRRSITSLYDIAGLPPREFVVWVR